MAATTRSSTSPARSGCASSAPMPSASASSSRATNAAALGCVYGGATVAAWYPITPSSSVAEAFARHCARYRVDPATKKHRFAVIQPRRARLDRHGDRRRVERARASPDFGPGISLDGKEFIGLAYFAEIPAVIFDVQRAPVDRHAEPHPAGRRARLRLCQPRQTPSTCCSSRKTRTNASPWCRCLRPRRSAADADLRPSDLDIGDERAAVRPLEWDDRKRFDRGKVMSEADLEAAKGVSDAISTSTATASPTGIFPDPSDARRLLPPAAQQGSLRQVQRGRPRLRRQHGATAQEIRPAKNLVPLPVRRAAKQATRFGAIYYGSTGPAMDEALDMLAAQGLHVDTLRVRAFPFHDEIIDFVAAPRSALRRRAEPGRAACARC